MASDQELRDYFKLKWVPVGVDEVQLATYSDFLETNADERSIILRTVFPYEFELLVEPEVSPQCTPSLSNAILEAPPKETWAGKRGVTFAVTSKHASAFGAYN